MIPRTLLVRTFLLVSTLIVLTVAIWAALLSLAEREPRVQQLAQLTTSAVNLTRAALVAADPAKRLDLLIELSEREGIRLYPAEAEDKLVELPDQPFYRLLRSETIKHLGNDTRLALAVNGEEGLWASFSLEDPDDPEDQYWVMLPPEHASRDFPWHWLSWGGASLALALLVAWWIVSRVTRPLRALSRAAAEVGRGRQPEPVPEAGADELKQLARSFNQMSLDLARNNAERAEILAGISHDLRTPLARLRLEAEMSVNDDSAREAIATDIDQMDAIIAQFLDYARGDGGESVEETHIDALLGTLVSHYERIGLSLKFDCAGMPEIPVRPMALRRAVGNLIENSRKYAGDDIALAAGLTDGRLWIEVSDRGPGIPAEEIERMKRPFTRLDAARTDTRGTGLGLAIVERIARLHGGSLDLQAREGGGLVARLSIPYMQTT